MVKSRVQEKSVHLVNYPKFVFVWPLIVAPGLLLVLEKLGCPSQVLGWIYVALATLVIMTLGMDLDRSTAFILSLVLCSLLLVGRLLHTEYSINIFGFLLWYFQHLKIEYDSGLAMTLASVLLAFYVWMFIWARIHNRWEINAFEFKHTSFGVVDQSLARGAKAVKTSYPDILEVLLGLSGSLHVYSANGDKELMTIHNIPLLPLVKKRISKVLNAGQTPQEASRKEEEAVANG